MPGHFGRLNVTGAVLTSSEGRECAWMLQSTYVDVIVLTSAVNLLT